MKYIRTKDGRILKGSNYGFGVGMPYKNYDVKVADTIEELCDKYICVEPNGEHTVLPSNSLICMKGTIVYGAIWCEFGLKYVAKMNEKGELELL